LAASVHYSARVAKYSTSNPSQEELTMRALTPWTGMTGLKKEMDRLFDRFLEPVWSEVPALGEWEPKVDVAETKDAITVKAEVPGVEQKDISISLQDNVLTIKGEKEEEKEEKDKRYHRVERSYGAFTRAMRLPAAVDAGKAAASFKDGVITITLPKAPEAKGTSIPVKAA
jgi:HSP20 family protein